MHNISTKRFSNSPERTIFLIKIPNFREYREWLSGEMCSPPNLTWDTQDENTTKIVRDIIYGEKLAFVLWGAGHALCAWPRHGSSRLDKYFFKVCAG